ncbi:MAG: helix-turn-helix transcriptional regulator [Syntrophobacteraceae bacterium]|nr:helix-turn-helix domain-containing protein [Desulfobacteraceae bacterium]
MITKHKKGGIEYEVGSENVFEDLGLDNAEELLAHSQLGIEVFRILDGRKLKQREIGALLGISQPDVSRLMNGHFSRFSKDKLFDFLKRLNCKVTIHIAPHREGEPYQVIRAAS